MTGQGSSALVGLVGFGDWADLSSFTQRNPKSSLIGLNRDDDDFIYHPIVRRVERPERKRKQTGAVGGVLAYAVKTSFDSNLRIKHNTHESYRTVGPGGQIKALGPFITRLALTAAQLIDL